MKKTAINDKIVRFFNERELTFFIERYGKDGQDWIAQCHQIPALMTGGSVYDEQEIQNQIKDAILTAAGVDGDYDSIVSRDISMVNQITASLTGKKQFAVTV